MDYTRSVCRCPGQNPPPQPSSPRLYASSLQLPTSASPQSGHMQEARPRWVSSLPCKPFASPALASQLPCQPRPPWVTQSQPAESSSSSQVPLASALPSLGPALPAVCLLNSWVWNSGALCFRVSLSNRTPSFSRPGTCAFISSSRVCALRPPPGSPPCGEHPEAARVHSRGRPHRSQMVPCAGFSFPRRGQAFPHSD